MKKMLLSFAHPDDESFSTGGTIAKYAKNGWEIRLIVATDGEKGDNAVNPDIRGEALGILREEEVRKAAGILGITEVASLHQKDGELSELTPGTLEDMIIEKMEAFLPHIVVTYDPTGLSNHPDHIKVSYATTFAFQKYAEHIAILKEPKKYEQRRGKGWLEAEAEEVFKGEDPERFEPKLYYVCMPESVATFLKKNKQIPEESHGKPWTGVPDKMISAVIDISKTKLTKGKALLCHETQMNDVDRFISFTPNPLINDEHFMLRMVGIEEAFMGKNDRVKTLL
jgi:LmbE family N-acetylglucosaminyl deacetylase